MNKNMAVFVAFFVTASCASILTGSIISYRANEMLLSCAALASAPMSNETMTQISVQQMANFWGGLLATFGGVSGIVGFLVNWWKSGDAAVVIGEIKDRLVSGEKQAAATFAGFYALIAAIRFFFLRTSKEAEAEKLLKELLQLGVDAEFSKEIAAK